jgi:hypothetical protein
MNIRSAFLVTLVLIHVQPPAVSVPLDLTGIGPGPISVIRTEDSVTVAWPDEAARVWRATFSLNPAQPLITSIGSDGEAVVRSARPFYQGETGKRRGGWYAFFDDPTTHPDGTRHAQSMFRLRGARARSVGERVEIFFDGHFALIQPASSMRWSAGYSDPSSTRSTSSEIARMRAVMP